MVFATTTRDLTVSAAGPSSDRRPGTPMCVTRTHRRHGAIGFPPWMQQTATCFLSLIATPENSRHFLVRGSTSQPNLSRPTFRSRRVEPGDAIKAELEKPVSLVEKFYRNAEIFYSRVRAILGSTGKLGFGRRFRGVVRSH